MSMVWPSSEGSATKRSRFVTGIGLGDGEDRTAVDLEPGRRSGAQRGLDHLVPVQQRNLALPLQAGAVVGGLSTGNRHEPAPGRP